MTIHHLKIFIAVAETGSMNAAAGKLFLSQSAVSQAIKELENHFDTLLFERIGRRISITPTGEKLLERAYQFVKDFDAIDDEIKNHGAKQTLRVGASVTVGSYLLSVVLREFEERCPEAETHVYVGNTAQIEEKLLSSELDIALVEGEVRSNNLVSIPAIRDFLVLACGIDHPLAAYHTLEASRINGQKFVMREEGSGTRALFDRFLHKHQLDVKCVWEAAVPDAFRSAILFNHCMAVVSVRLLQSDIMNEQIRIFVPESHEFDRFFSLVAHRNKAKNSAIKIFEEIVMTHEEPEWMHNLDLGVLI